MPLFAFGVVDINVSTSITPTSVNELQVLDVTVVVDNVGDENITSAEIWSPLTTNVFELVSGSFGGDVIGALDGDTIKWTTGALTASATQTYTFQVRVMQGAYVVSSGSANITASLNSSVEPDENAANDSDSQSFSIVPVEVNISQSASSTNLVEGQTVTFEIEVVNNVASSTATDVQIRNVVPSGLTYISSSIAGGSSRNDSSPNSGQGLSWTIDSLTDTPVTLTFQAQVNAGAKSVSPITNTSTVLSLDQDNVGGTESANSVLNILGLDIGIAKSASSTNPIEGEEVTYTIAVSNLSSQTATNVVVEDILNSNLNYVASSISGGDSNNDSSPNSGTGLRWTINSLGAGASQNLSFDAEVVAGAFSSGPIIPNTASLVSISQTEENAANNSADADITVSAFDLVLGLQVSQSSPEENEEIIFTIEAENTHATEEATQVVVRNIVPSGLTFKSGSMTGGSTTDSSSPSGSGLQWTINTLPATQSRTLTFVATVDNNTAGDTINNTASITSLDQSDTNATNNSETVSVTPEGLDISVELALGVSEEPIHFDIPVE